MQEGSKKLSDAENNLCHSLVLIGWFYCEVPEMFCGLRIFTQLSNDMRGEMIMTEVVFLGELVLLFCTFDS